MPASPGWSGQAIAVALMVVGAYGGLRLVGAVARRRWSDAEVAFADAFMAVAMVGMFVPGWNGVPARLGEVVFAAGAIHAAITVGRTVAATGGAPIDPGAAGHRRVAVAHGAVAVVMLYMYWLGMPMAASGSGRSMSMSMSMSMDQTVRAVPPAITLLVAVALIAGVVWPLAPLGWPGRPARFAGLAPTPAGPDVGPTGRMVSPAAGVVATAGPIVATAGPVVATAGPVVRAGRWGVPVVGPDPRRRRPGRHGSGHGLPAARAPVTPRFPGPDPARRS